MSDVKPIIVKNCYGCHGPGGAEQQRSNFTTYAGVHQWAPTIGTQVFDCIMPPSDAGQPTLAEREAILTWLVCGAPNN